QPDPKLPREVADFSGRVFVPARRRLHRLERHAAFRAVAGSVGNHFRMHGTGELTRPRIREPGRGILPVTAATGMRWRVLRRRGVAAVAHAATLTRCGGLSGAKLASSRFILL